MSFIVQLPQPFFVLAPMDDVTDTVFRQVVANTSPPDLFFTEFVNVDGLQSAGRNKLLPKLQFNSNEQPLIAQIWGKGVDNYKQTAQQLADGTLAREANKASDNNSNYVGIDLNMGCPDKSICSNGCCAALINDRELASQIIKTVQKAAAGKLPVSVKTRIGYNEIDLSWIEFLLEHNLDMLTVHARTKKEMSKVPNHFEVYGEIVAMRDKLSPNTKLVANGDILSRRQGLNLAKQYNFDGIMIGRGIFNDPFVFAETSDWQETDKNKKLDLFAAHVNLFDNTWKSGERRQVTLNKFCKTYINNFEGAAELRTKFMAAATTTQLMDLINQERSI